MNVSVQNEVGKEFSRNLVGKLFIKKMVSTAVPFFNLRKSMSPAYLFNEIPPVRDVPYSLRSSCSYAQPVSRTVRFSNTYFINTIFEWNLLDEDTRNSVSIGESKRKLLVQIRPPCRHVYTVHRC